MNQDKNTRREFIKTAILTSAGAQMMLSPSNASAVEVKSDRITECIDAHSHIWTTDVKNFPLANGKTVKNLSPGSFTDQELLAVANPNGVNRVVLIQHHIFHGDDNSYLIHAAKQNPGTFKVVGMINNQEPGIRKKMKELLKQNVTGLRVHPFDHKSDQWLEGDGVKEMWATAAETRQNICCLINPADIPYLNQMCVKYPDTPVVVDHFARIGVDGKIRNSDLNNLCKLAKQKNTTIKISAYYALGKKKPPYLDLAGMIKQLYEAFGPERLMWASDAPYQLTKGNTYADSINLIQEKLDFLSQNDKEWILKKTAEKVFFSI